MKLRYKVSVIVAVLAAVSTVIPAPAHRPNMLGYYSHCSWTPLSTLICLAIAGVFYWLGRRNEGEFATKLEEIQRRMAKTEKEEASKP